MSEPNTKYICDFFNNRAENWDKNDEHDEKKIISLLSQIGLRENDRVLDLGCGTGIISTKLYEMTRRQIYALDLSSNMIDEAIKKQISPEKVSFHVGDFYTLEDGEFDAIVVFDAYPHFIELKAFKESLLRNLAVDGKFAIVHDLGRQQLHDCHKGRDVSCLSRELFDPRKEAEFYKDEFNILKAEEGEDYYLLIGEKKKQTPVIYSLTEESDRRRKKTRYLLIDCFYSLLKNEPYESITASDVIRSSKVSSSTFYSHFKTKDDIIVTIVDSLLEHVLSEKKKKEENHDFSKEKDPLSLLTHLFLHLKEDKEGLLLLLKDREGKEIFREKMREALAPLMSSFLDCGVVEKEGLDHSFLTLFLSDSLTSYLSLWLISDAGLSPQEAAEGFLQLYQ